MQVLDAYMSYMTKVMELMGGESAKVEEEMHNLYEFERRMAEVSILKQANKLLIIIENCN